jgi:ABC-2 type transport system permease protein
MNPPSVGRLTTVEIRKMTDTRSGVWLLAVGGLVSAAIVTLVLVVGDAPDMTFAGLFAPTLFPLSVFLPIVGILSVTTEWSQRTALTTFALVPRRHRVAAAKLIAAVLLAVVVAAASLAFAAAANALGSAVAGGDGSWRLPAAELGEGVLYLVVNTLLGVGLGLLLMNSALAIVMVLVLPVVWSVLSGVAGALRTAHGWLDISETSGLLIESTAMAGEEWAKLGTSFALWVLLPMTLGLVRLLRREVA